MTLQERAAEIADRAQPMRPFVTTLEGDCLALIADMAREIERLEASKKKLRSALLDMRSGWRYIRHSYGDLYGVGWARCEKNSTEALEESP